MLDKLVIAEDKYPREPRPSIELKSAAEEINVEGTVERYPIDPKPTNELVLILFVASTVVEIYWAVPRPVIVDTSSSVSIKLVI